MTAASSDLLAPSDTFAKRHIGPEERDIAEMLAQVGCASLAELVDQTIPRAIRREGPLRLAGLGERELGEREVLERLRAWPRRIACCAPASAWATRTPSCRR